MLLFHNRKPQLQKQQRLGKQLQAINTHIIGIEIATLYFLILKNDDNSAAQAPHISSDYNNINTKKVCQLLNINDTDGDHGWPWAESVDTVLFYAVPRSGTISPWASKATDIFEICGINTMAAVERGFCYRLLLDKRLAPPTIKARMVDDTSIIGIDDIKAQLYDRMTEDIYSAKRDIENWLNGMHFNERMKTNQDMQTQAVIMQPSATHHGSNAQISDYVYNCGKKYGLSDDETSQLKRYYLAVGRIPTDSEMMMYAQVNSEHCRHKLFNAHWLLDSKRQEKTLFEMIKSTSILHDPIISAYQDNASVIKSAAIDYFKIAPDTRRYIYENNTAHAFLIKVETHNHPTAISPFAGAATGSGGEIRDESATGRGGRPRMGLVGFSLSNLCIPGFEQPWESSPKYPARIANALQIIIDAPLGAARFNNEFGRPCVCGYFRTYEQQQENHHWGYHKPIMIAGGLGSIRAEYSHKKAFPPTTPLVVFGGPAMRIGLGGGSASSTSSGSSSHELDFASVQRDNAEMQRRCQEVIEQCTARTDNPILSIHDVGAGGLANALPELVHNAGLGAHIQLDKIPCADNSLSPMEIWCNESQERYVAAIDKIQLSEFKKICARERCPWAKVGEATQETILILEDKHTSTQRPIEMPMAVLFAKPSDDKRSLKTIVYPDLMHDDWHDINIDDALERVLKMPAVASKSFLITIADRSVGGLICRDQMVGPRQVPVSDVAVAASDYNGNRGHAMAMGERTPLAIIDAAASGRLAVVEAILNIAAAEVDNLHDIYLSANWMVNATNNEQRLALYQTVHAVTELCKTLGIAIPVGKDSLSMQSKWEDRGQSYEVNSPLSLIISAFATVTQVQNTLTPQLDTTTSQKRIFLIDLSDGNNRLGASCLLQAYQRTAIPPDVNDAQQIIDFFALMRTLRAHNHILAYHDRSDGGLLIALVEMAFAGHCGVSCELDDNDELIPTLFSEAPGVLIQPNEEGVKQLHHLIATQYSKTLKIREIGHLRHDLKFEIKHKKQSWRWDLMQLKRWWSETGSRIQAQRDDPQCAREEMDFICDAEDPGLNAQWDFDLPTHFASDVTAPTGIHSTKPKVAILREQGVNGHIEMAGAYERAGFSAYDVSMNDLINGTANLESFHGLAVCGGFSYGDVLGGGAGWAHSILMHPRTRAAFAAFFERNDTFTLGVCNGCQMLSRIKEIIPGTSHWPIFETNRSNQFESRLVKVEITPSPSVLFVGMTGAQLPIIVAHGEGKTTFPNAKMQQAATAYSCLRYIDNYNRSTEHYPQNPNGSQQGMTAFCSKDGRVTIMMPHPERLFKTTQYSWHHRHWGEVAPWFKLFQNAYSFCK